MLATHFADTALGWSIEGGWREIDRRHPNFRGTAFCHGVVAGSANESRPLRPVAVRVLTVLRDNEGVRVHPPDFLPGGFFIGGITSGWPHTLGDCGDSHGIRLAGSRRDILFCG